MLTDAHLDDLRPLGAQEFATAPTFQRRVWGRMLETHPNLMVNYRPTYVLHVLRAVMDDVEQFTAVPFDRQLRLAQLEVTCMRRIQLVQPQPAQ